MSLCKIVADKIFKYRKLLLAFSGGIDSTVLLDILFKLSSTNVIKFNEKFFIRVIHVNHGLNRLANDWTEHCRQQCEIRKIPFHAIYIKNDDIKKRNIESVMRDFRYRSLSFCLKDQEILLTAHHMEDQVETFFLALKRGSGPLGLKSMLENTINNDYQCQILRPLLTCTRLQIKEYANQNKLNWIQDDENLNTKFDRNFLRIKVLPTLYRRWPYFNRVITRATQLCGDTNSLLNEFLLDYSQKFITLDQSLLIKPLKNLSILKINAVLRFWLSKFFLYIPSYQLINRIWYEVALSKQDAMPKLQLNKKNMCCRFRNKLYLVPITMKNFLYRKTISWAFVKYPLLLPNNLGLLISKASSRNNNKKKVKNKEYLTDERNVKIFLFEKFQFKYKLPEVILTSCFVRSPTSKEKIFIKFGNISELLYLSNKNHGKCLKKIWKEFNIPPWLRNRIPLLFYNSTLISAIGIFVTKNGVFIEKKHYIGYKIFWLQDYSSYKIFRTMFG